MEPPTPKSSWFLCRADGGKGTFAGSLCPGSLTNSLLEKAPSSLALDRAGDDLGSASRLKMDFHMREGSWLINTSSRVTNSSVGKINLHAAVENSSPISQEVTMVTVYSHFTKSGC